MKSVNHANLIYNKIGCLLTDYIPQGLSQRTLRGQNSILK